MRGTNATALDRQIPFQGFLDWYVVGYDLVSRMVGLSSS